MADTLTQAQDPQVLITAEVIERLRLQHMRLYERRLASGSRAVIANETMALFDLWRGMAGKTWLLLSDAEEDEVVDALFDEGWEFQCDGDDEIMTVRMPSGRGKAG